MDITITDQEVGATCPHCRLALTAGAAAHRCDLCRAVYHEGCWRDGGGCAIYGCANAPAAPPAARRPDQSPLYIPPAPPTAAAGPPPPSSAAYVPGPPPGHREFPLRAVLLGLAALLLVGLLAGGGYFLTHRDTPAAQRAATGPAATPRPQATTDAKAHQTALAHRIQRIVAFSQAGRTAVRNGRFAAAVANRKTVLRRLQAVKGASGDLASAQRTLVRAMTASLHSDQAYAAGRDASASDRRATTLKADFVRRWRAVATAYGLRALASSDI
jgi:hypothetical protein